MDKIIIENLTVFAYHGVLEEEQRLGQKFVVCVEMEADLHGAGINDDLNKTVNYAEACAFITEYTKNNPCKLIEAAAEQHAQGLLVKYTMVKAVTVTVKKPWAPIMLPIDYAGVTIRRERHTAYLSIGSNIGDKKAYLDFALQKLGEDEKCNVCAVSDYITTKPVGDVVQDDFLNGAVKIETLYSPHELLCKIHEIEAEAGRERKIHWGPRTLDIDIILYDDAVVDSADLKIPHPEMKNREFVLKPLSQLAPYAKNPVNGKSVCDMLAELESIN